MGRQLHADLCAPAGQPRTSGFSRFAPHLLGLVVAGVLFLVPALGSAQTLSLQAKSRQIYAELPFALSVVAEGFGDATEPNLSDLVIPGADVQFMGVVPQVSNMITIVNGRRTQSQSVTYVYQFQVTAQTAGDYTIPVLTATQGLMTASTQEANFTARAIQTTKDMQLEVELPKRPVWIGETFDLKVRWLLRKDVSDHNFVIPIFNDARFEITAPAHNGQHSALDFDVGHGKKLRLPFTKSQAQRGAETFTQFEFRAQARATKAGLVQFAPAAVVASLQTGTTRDRFGFPTAKTELFKAGDVARQLEVKPVPTVGRPKSFANAIGSGFTIEITADRTVVQVGEPIELEITIKGKGNLEGLILPSLSADGLNPKTFAIPRTPPVGETVENKKVFRVSVRLKNDKASEIPPIGFSFFNPKTGDFETVRSQPIALSVSGTTKVSAAEVVSGAETSPTASQGNNASTSGNNTQPELSLTGADLGLSDPASTLDAPIRTSDITWLLVFLYLAPIGLLIGFVVRLQRADKSSAAKEAKQMDAALRDALKRAESEPASEVAGALSKALRTALGSKATSPQAASVLEELDVVGYDPKAKGSTLPSELLRSAQKLAQTLGRAATFLLVAATGLMLHTADASAASDKDLAEARDAYQRAMAEAERAPRVAGFSRAESLFAELVEVSPRSPNLLVDWGNAALAAQKTGVAVLAYRRALELDPGNERAKRNLVWVRSVLPEWLPQPEDDQATNAFFFLNDTIPTAWRALLAAICFALTLLIVIPWRGANGGQGRKTKILFAIVPFGAWLFLLASTFVSDGTHTDGVIVSDGVLMRSADSAGATAALAEPLPAGAEVGVIERREHWVKIELADGASGWVQKEAIEMVAP